MMHRRYIAPIIPSEQDATDAANARQAIAAGRNVTLHDLPPAVTRLIMNILEETAAGNAVTMVPVEAEITTRQAADLLNVSRPHLVSLVDNGTLPARLVGRHRRLLLRDVLTYKADLFAKRSKVLDEIIAIDQELGLI